MFMLFAGYRYYPSGGWGDFVQVFDTLADAESVGKDLLEDGCDWAHVVNSITYEETTVYRR